MDLDKYQLGFFKQQCGLSLAALGVDGSDVNILLEKLDRLFTRRCSPPTQVPGAGPAELQAICIAPNCPLDTHADCAAYPNKGVANAPGIANGTLAGNLTATNGTGSSLTNSSSTSGVSMSSAAAAATQTTNAAYYGRESCNLGSVVAAATLASLLWA